MLGGYARIAPPWRAAGWPMLPVHRGVKELDVKGFTGAAGVDPTPDQYEKWDRERPGDNAAIRMLPDVVGLDIDAYKPEGARSWSELLDECGGPPPDTYVITSRTDEVSGIRLYRTPPGTRLKGAPRKGIEAIQRVKPRQAYFTHMAHTMEYDELMRTLPKGIEPAYDGLKFTF